MKLSCEIVRDLLPLYEDGVCSPQSREAVRSHLAECGCCAAMVGKALPQIDLPEAEPEEKAVVKSFRKVRRRWAISLVSVLLALPVLYVLGSLGWNEYRKEGVCFSNLDTVWAAENFVDALEDRDFQAVADSMDFTEDYESIRDALSMTLEDYLPRLTQVRLNGTDYRAANEEIAGQCQKADFWENVVFNGWYQAQGPENIYYSDMYRVMIPEDVFLRTIEGQEYYNDGKGICLMYGQTYYLVELKWGRYYIGHSQYADVMLCKDSARDLCKYLDLWPEAMYQEAKPQLEAEALESWQSSQAWNAPYADMSLEAYTALRREQVVQELEALTAQGVRIENKGVEDAYYVDRGWTVQIAVSMETPGQTMRFALDLREDGSYLKLTGSQADPKYHDNSWYHALTDALF